MYGINSLGNGIKLNMDSVSTYRAGSIKQRLDLHEVTSRLNPKTRARIPLLRILESIIESIDVLLEQRARDILPEDASILRARDSQVLLLSADRPSRFSDPDGLALGMGLGGEVGIVEGLVGVLDAIGHGSLEVGICVHAEEVGGSDYGTVGVVYEGSPGIDMADGLAVERSIPNSVPGALDVADQNIGLLAYARLVLDSSGRDTVEVFAADGDADDEVGESGAVLLNSSLQSSYLVSERSVILGSPETEE